jgi:hypothetical protein
MGLASPSFLTSVQVETEYKPVVNSLRGFSYALTKIETFAGFTRFSVGYDRGHEYPVAPNNG